jgi:hypothetical protein
MRSCLAGLSVALVSEPFWFGTLPASAKPTEFQDNSFHTDRDGDASMLEAEGTRALTAAIGAAAHAVHDGSAALPFCSATLPCCSVTLAEAETDGTKHVQEFRPALNERKAGPGMIGAEPTTPLTKMMRRNSPPH